MQRILGKLLSCVIGKYFYKVVKVTPVNKNQMFTPRDKIFVEVTEQSEHSCPICGIDTSLLIPVPIPEVNPCDANCRKIKID